MASLSKDITAGPQHRRHLSLPQRLAGHRWTILPSLEHAAQRAPSTMQPWSTSFDDPDRGKLTLHGRLGQFADDGSRDHLVIIIHGLGGDHLTSPYMNLAAQAAARAKIDVLLMNRRGAGGRSARDIYHAGLLEDVWIAARSKSLRDYRQISLLGYSLGGMMALHCALAAERDDRLAAVAAICPPLDLEIGTRHLDDPRQTIYRRHVMRGLNLSYAKAHAHRPLPTHPSALRAIDSIRGWDAMAIAPRFGFDTVQHNYDHCSMHDRLGQLTLPALLVHAPTDPMIPLESIVEPIRAGNHHLTTRLVDGGGHVYFPPNTQLDLGVPSHDVHEQALRWLDAQRAKRS